MERTTQELMDALLSKRDVEDYLRENAGNCCPRRWPPAWNRCCPATG